MTGPAGPAAARIDDPPRRCQLSPTAIVAVPLDRANADRIGTRPGYRIALLTDEALWNE